jgi:O-antigen ligase
MMSAPHAVALVRSVLDSPRFVHACTVAAIGTGFLADTLQRLIGWPGMLAVVVVLVLTAGASFLSLRGTIGWQAVLPVSLLIFVGWAGLSLLWSQYRWATVGGTAYLVAFTVLGLYVALLRDTIQIVRSFGDVLRLVLSLSLAVEIFAGVLIDMPLRFLAVDGNLAELGPIQGLLATRNQMGLVAVIAIITFTVELLTRSVSHGIAIGSIVLATLCLLLSRSPVALGVAAAVGIAALALYLTRRFGGPRRLLWQWGTPIAAVVLAIIAWVLRAPLIALLSANSELSYRLALWRRLWNLITTNPLQGWGWLGRWRPDIQPFTFLSGAREPTSAVNAYLDVWFQLGLAGIFIFVVLVGLAFTRSWILAGRQRSVVFTWPALVLVVLLVGSLAESSILVEYGWLTFVVCCVKAARELSWRGAFAALRPGDADEPLPREA